MKSTCFILTWCALAILAVNAPLSFAQVQQPPQSQGAINIDSQIASCLILGNQNEVALAKLAEEKTKNSKVTSFAKKMVKDHDQCIDELTKFASQNFRTRHTESTSTSPNTRTSAPQVGAVATGAQRARSNDPWALQLQIHEEMADQCLASARRELGKEQGKEFDECYIGMQIGAHMKMVDELKVLEGYTTSPQLRSVLKQGQETAQKHLEEAKEIKKQLAKNKD